MSPWIPVQSSLIKEVALDEQSRVIAINAKGQELFYEIRNPRINIKSLFQAFLNAPSKGKFYNQVFMKNKRLLIG